MKRSATLTLLAGTVVVVALVSAYLRTRSSPPPKGFSISGISLGASWDEVDSRLQERVVSDNGFYEPARFYHHRGKLLMVAPGEGSNQVSAVVGEELWLDGLVVLSTGDSQEQAEGLIRGRGETIVRHSAFRDSSDTTLWLEIGHGRWLDIDCDDGKVKEIHLDQPAAGNARIGPSKHVPVLCAEYLSQWPCAECVPPRGSPPKL